MFQGCFKHVSNMSQGCLKDVSSVFHGCIKGGLRKLQRILKQVSRGFPEDLKENPGCFKSNSIGFQINFMKISKVFQRNSKVF